MINHKTHVLPVAAGDMSPEMSVRIGRGDRMQIRFFNWRIKGGGMERERETETGPGRIAVDPAGKLCVLALSPPRRRQLASSRCHLDAICFYGYCAVLLLLLLQLLQLMLWQCKSMRRIAANIDCAYVGVF